jgi:ankyrin repeat protein
MRYADVAEAASGAPVGAPTEQVGVTAARRAAVAPPAANVTDSAAAFRQAAEAGDLGALDRLLGMQPDINARDAAGCTPLMLAVLHGQTGAVSALLAYGADPNAADRRGTTPLQAARAAGRPAIIAALQRYGAR